MQYNQRPGSNQSGTSPSGNQQSSTRNQKGNFWDRLTNIIKKFFKIIRKLLLLLSDILQECLQTFVFVFAIAIKFFSSPSTPCILSIVVFGIVITITTVQWYALGLWFGKLFALSSIGGHSMGVVGLFFGVCVNSFQLSSELWKISRQFAEYYSKHNVDPNKEPAADASVKQRLVDWLNHDHKNLKSARRVSYIVETALMLTYTLVGNLNIYGLVLGVMSLVAPEQSLKFVASTISLLGGISGEETTEPEQKNKV